MNLRRTLLIVAALLVVVFGALSFGMLAVVSPTAGACQICGDGYCAPSCENKYTCPKDCGGTAGAR